MSKLFNFIYESNMYRSKYRLKLFDGGRNSESSHDRNRSVLVYKYTTATNFIYIKMIVFNHNL